MPRRPSLARWEDRRPSLTFGGSLLPFAVGLEVHCDAVDAIALMGRRRPIVEDVAEMAAAGRAMDLGPLHAKTVVRRCLDAAGDRLVEARPAGAALELAL